jgi:hypothetical protein
MSLILSGTDGLSDVDGSASTPAIRGTDTNTGIFFPAADTIAFSEGGTESMRITSDGNVGIGTSSPQCRLQVTSSAFPVLKVADAIGGGALALGDAGTNNNYVGAWRGTANSVSGGGFLNIQGNGIAFMSSDSVFGSGSERMRIDSSGRLLVGSTATTSGGNTISAGGINITASANFGMGINMPSGDQFAVLFANGGINVGSIAVTGSTTTYNTSSDYRLKENIAPMIGALATVSALKPVTYTWKIDGSDGQGFIAHELAEVVPDCVTGEKDALNEDGNPQYQGIDTSFLVATLTAAIQEQQAIITEQSLALQELKSRIEMLEAKK